jgi:hypothetical protein
LLSSCQRINFDIELSISISKLQLRCQSYNFDIKVNYDIQVSTSISKFLARYYRKLRLCTELGGPAIPAGTVRFLGLRDSHVKKFATFSLVSNKTSFFNTPAHHASLSKVIKGLRKITSLNNTPSVVKYGVLGGGRRHDSWAW